MEGGGVYHDSRMPNNNERLPCSSDSLWPPNSSPSFHGSASMVSFEDARGETNTEKPFFSKLENCANDDFDGCFHPPEKKRRLSSDQVQFLEKSFEVENKLEPERKIQLAKELGLQPRQVAIWFQNRRARYKTKVLEREYDSLKSSYDKLKSDYDNLFKENEKMKNEVKSLTEKLVQREKLTTKLEPSSEKQFLSLDSITNAVAASSAKSDVFDSESPHYADGNHIEAANSSHVVESDFSQDEDDNLSRKILPSMCFPKLEIAMMIYSQIPATWDSLFRIMAVGCGLCCILLAIICR